ncbi:cell division protein FtsL [Thermomonas sp.]|uniref:cell division protein FtsL n=1 Tax=Thermomonas sp. TaxID=1971895 RepID=UPI00238900D7|nr:cell division protein FtsL [Thermomonas sp.]MBS0458539.1 cell division protein FtsL [Pseudomonadota bacterium]MDE2380599.1 cell division protein FtsL [Xanthomonadaceae bacterium]HOC11175.1 cell division protein FtsL [Thermomonas sp.]HQA02069.1 cell division protein FtsL [Thermomonas sp.]HQE08264.1 cell division protein FtsL [Thermomonas sp.]
MRGLLLTVLVLANIATALLIVRDRHEHRQAFVALTRLEKARDTLNIEFGRLQLEQATWAESNRVDQVARVQLGMVFPRTEDTVVLRR